LRILLPGVPEPGGENPHPIYARSGWEIPLDSEKLPESTVKQMQLRAKHWLDTISGITVRSLSGFPYNCVGMIFACRRAAIDIDHIYNILREDGYRRIDRSQLKPGDVVLYKDQNGQPTHVALVIAIERYKQVLNIQVMSKWGGTAPEFVHFVESVPDLYGNPSEFYTDRIEP